MKILKFLLLWITLTIVMVVSWSIGFLVGNGITQTITPQAGEASVAFVSFLGVCVVNSFILSSLLWFTNSYSGPIRSVWLVIYCYVIMFVLTQMETFFFSNSIGIGTGQVVSILIAGFVMSFTTVITGILIEKKLQGGQRSPLEAPISQWQHLISPFALLTCVVYPVIYLTFGYFIAWQNENLRVFYSKSAELKPFFAQSTSAFADGIYFFQIFRAAIWVIILTPVILMLKQSKGYQYPLVGTISFLPATLLFIPNPYMPADIAMTHFAETVSSNLLWSLIVTFVVNKYLSTSKSKTAQPVFGKSAG